MKLGIATKISILAVVLVLGTAGTLGLVLYTGTNAILIRHELDNIGEDLHLWSARLALTIETLRQDVQSVSYLPPIHGIIRTQLMDDIDPVYGSSDREWRQRLEAIFAEFLRAKPNYLRIRYIGIADAGRELVRVERVGESIIRATDAELRSKGHTIYFQETVNMRAGEVYLSDVHLNRKHGQVVEPHIPVIRAAVPIYSLQGTVFGMVIIDMDCRTILRHLYHDKRQYYLTNDRGDFLVHPDPAMIFGFDLGRRHRIQESRPEFAAMFAPGNRDRETAIGPAINGSNDVEHFLKVAFDPLHPERFLGLTEAVPYQEVVAKSMAIRNRSLVLTLLLIAGASALAFFLSRMLVRSLHQITRAAEGFADGIFDVSLPVQATDEIGILARSFQTMIQHVRERGRALQENEACTRAIVNTAAEGIVTINAQGIIESFNKAAQLIFGYEPAEVLGQSITMLMPSPYREEHDNYMRRYLRTGEGKIIGTGIREVVGQRQDGTTFHMDLAISEVQLGARRIFTGIVRDTTERKQTETALQEAKEAAEDASRAKSAFLATMSHEIRTPMNGIIGMTSLLLDTALTAEQRDCTETVRNSGQALLTIINDILDFSKIEAGKMNLEVIDFDLRTMVEDTLELLAEHAQSKGLEITCLVHADVPTWVAGDPGRVRQILINLLGNAVKFTETGEVVVRVTLAEATGNDAHIRFTVTDTGIGIPPATRTRLFQAFTQADGSTTRKYGGTGLGLAICQQLVALMGGNINVESEPGKGSTFWFTVRLTKQPMPNNVTPVDVSALRGLRILCVDDNATNRTILQLQLSAWDMQVDCVEDGPRALERLHMAQQDGKPYTLAILDMFMPGMDGMTLAHTMKADAVLAAVRLIMLTSFSERGHGAEAHRAGIAAYLTKPVRRSQLYHCLATVMSAATAQPSTPLVTRHRLAEAQAQLHARVLVAEDNVVNQKVAVRILEKLGCRVDVVANGLEALEALGRISYDLIFMDCQMPEMDGYEATAAIRQHEGITGHTPIIAMTANAMQGDRARVLEAGMDDYLPKPVKAGDLATMLQHWLPHPDGASEAGAEHRATEEYQADIVFDSAALLAQIDGDGTLLQEMTELFLQDYPQHLTAIREAIAGRDSVALQQAAHTLKGAVGNFHAQKAFEAVLRLETMGRNGEIQDAAEVYAALTREITVLKDALTSLREEDHAPSL